MNINLKSYTSSHPDRVGGFMILVGIMLLSFLIWQFYPSQIQNRNNKREQSTSSEICVLSPTNLCDSKIVEVTGVVDSADIVEDLGYRFTPDSLYITNPIYITAIRYEGSKAYDGTKDSFYVPIPFGTKVKIRGTMITREVAWCTQREYAETHPTNCREGNTSIAISPLSVVSINPVFADAYSYTISGRINDQGNIISECPGTVTLCEGFTKSNCVKLNLEKRYCSNLLNKQNDLLISGHTKSLSDALNPTDITSITSTSYSSTEVNERMERRADRYSNTDLGIVKVFNHTGAEISTIYTGQSQYYDLGEIIPTTKDIYYFANNFLYKNTNGTQEQIGKISTELLSEPDEVTGNILSPDQESIITLIYKNVSSQPLGSTSYMLSKNNYKLVRIWLEEAENGILKHEVLFEKNIEGSVGLSKYNFQTNEAILTYNFDDEQPEPCVKTHIYAVNTELDQQTEIFSEIIDARRNCSEQVHRVLSISPDGHTIISAYDFNEQVGGPLPRKLVITKIADNYNTTRKEMTSESSILGSGFNSNIGFSVKDANTLNIYNSLLPDIFYTFNTNKSEFTRTTLTPKENLALVDKDNEETSRIAYLREPAFIYEDSNNWYFMNRDIVDNQLYSLSKKNKEVLLLNTFSLLARYSKVGDKLYIFDFGKN
jgi:hypothetical protein